MKGKFNYYPENKDMIDYIMLTFRKQLLRIRCKNFPINPEYVTNDTVLIGLNKINFLEFNYFIYKMAGVFNISNAPCVLGMSDALTSEFTSEELQKLDQ